MTESKITFNLWTEPWITLEKEEGGVERLSIEETLKRAQNYRAIYESSPLVVVGIHRLLVAILQFALNPQENGDLKKLWHAGKFPVSVIDDFGKNYARRFDLFSEKEPFMQSADLPIQPGKKDALSYVSRLTYDIPSGTYVTHYRHGTEDDVRLCPTCTAKQLLVLPAFATAGGRPYRPSINGVPPLYIIPGGNNLFESLVASLVTPAYQPNIRSRKKDQPWWIRKPVIGFCLEINDVGYCHSLTFTARRTRVHPRMEKILCSRCGERTDYFVNTLAYEMGESRPKNAEVWFDPFVAYEPKGQESKIDGIRPRESIGWSVWREFASLFLLPKSDGTDKTRRPSLITQLDYLDLKGKQTLAFRCIGILTDQAKVIEWWDAGFDIPPIILRDEEAGYDIRKAMSFSNENADICTKVFRKNFRRAKSEQHKVVLKRMVETFWEQMAEPFRQYVLRMNDPQNFDAAQRFWADEVIGYARSVFNQAAQSLGDDAERLAQHAKAEKELNIQLSKKRKEFLNE